MFMSKKKDLKQDQYSTLHEESCKKKLDFYIDPETGYLVFTKLKLFKNKKCCDSGCRHCPYKEDPSPT